MFNRDIDTVISRLLVDKNQLWIVGILIVLRFLGTIIRVSDSLKKESFTNFRATSGFYAWAAGASGSWYHHFPRHAEP